MVNPTPHRDVAVGYLPDIVTHAQHDLDRRIAALEPDLDSAIRGDHFPAGEHRSASVAPTALIAIV